jgi:tRNA A-37 threonylcarbamoyl transferase component Bud32
MTRLIAQYRSLSQGVDGVTHRNARSESVPQASAAAAPSTVLINPRYERVVKRHGLDNFDRVMQWKGGRTVCRHANRDVARIEIEEDGQVVCLFLKREWQTYFKDRVRNWIEGIGWGTKSRREWHVIAAMIEARVGCAEPVVLAERSGFRPQGYIVLRGLVDAVLLRPYLKEHRGEMTVPQQRQLAAHLGREVARLHAAGINHPDLFSKHVLLSCKTGQLPEVCFIDLQRSSTRRVVSRASRVQDLASLDASLPPQLASHSDRLAFLQSYLSASASPLAIKEFASAIRRRSRKLQTRRKIREMREIPDVPLLA